MLALVLARPSPRRRTLTYYVIHFEIHPATACLWSSSSGRSARWLSRPSRHRWRGSGGGATSPLGSDSCPGRTLLEARRCWAGYRRWASATSGAVDHWRDDDGALGGPARRAAGFMAGPDAGAQAAHAGCGGAGQQDGAHRLGTNDEQASL